MQVLQTKDLSKNYGLIKAVDQLSFRVNSGDVLGVLGPNGSGKTTTLGMVLGIIRPTYGEYSWFDGQDANPLLKIGSLLETPNHYPYLSGLDNLKITAHIKRVDERGLDQLAELVGLSDRIQHKVKTYSLGMKQRLAIASAMVGEPDLLIFDEPTNGLDPSGIAEIRKLILEIASSGKTIIMASHILAEVEKTCSHCLILKSGRMVSYGTVADILKGANSFMLGSINLEGLAKAVAGLPGYVDHYSADGFIVASFREGTEGQHLNSALQSKGIMLSHLSQKKRKLEDAFIELLNGN